MNHYKLIIPDNFNKGIELWTDTCSFDKEGFSLNCTFNENLSDPLWEKTLMEWVVCYNNVSNCFRITKGQKRTCYLTECDKYYNAINNYILMNTMITRCLIVSPLHDTTFEFRYDYLTERKKFEI